ncbi:MAG: hypothetical protein PVF43_05225 [Candidatus Eiseniibacteriota bacterium]|jgi:hypothetical protein
MNWNQRSLALVALLMLCTMVVSGTAEGARRSGLAGNLLIKDADDVFFFPQYNLHYVDQFTIDMGSDANSGSGTFIFGTDTWALNLSTHRSDFLGGIVNAYWNGTDRGIFSPMYSPNFAGATGTGPAAQNPMAFQWFDVGFATTLGATPFGLRISSGIDTDKVENSTTTERSASAFSIQAGATMADAWDLGAEVTFGNSDDKDSAAPGNDLSGDVFLFAAGVRGYMEAAGLDWGVLGSFGIASSEYDVQPDSSVTEDITAFMVGFGPVWQDEAEDWTVAGYLTLERQSLKTEPGPTAGVTEQTMSAFTFPGYRLAAERRVFSWMKVRGGVRSDYQFDKNESTSSGGTVTATERDYDFRWTGGVSFEVGDFVLDGAINEPWFTSGPSIIGNDTDFLAFASATYHWGGDE